MKAQVKESFKVLKRIFQEVPQSLTRPVCMHRKEKKSYSGSDLVQIIKHSHLSDFIIAERRRNRCWKKIKLIFLIRNTLFFPLRSVSMSSWRSLPPGTEGVNPKLRKKQKRKCKTMTQTRITSDRSLQRSWAGSSLGGTLMSRLHPLEQGLFPG